MDLKPKYDSDVKKAFCISKRENLLDIKYFRSISFHSIIFIAVIISLGVELKLPITDIWL